MKRTMLGNSLTSSLIRHNLPEGCMHSVPTPGDEHIKSDIAICIRQEVPRAAQLSSHCVITMFYDKLKRPCFL